MEFKNKIKRRIALFALYMVIGAALCAVCFLNKSVNDTINAVGMAFIACGAVRIFQYAKILGDPEKLRELEVSEKDERNIALMEKARSYAFAVYITAAAIAVIVLFALNMDLAARVVAYNVCGMVLIYLVCYAAAKRRF